MSLLTPSSTQSLACWLLHLFTFWHINIESTFCLGGSVPHMISDSRPEVETCMAKNLAPAPDPMLSLSCRVLGLCKYVCWRWMAVCFCSHIEFLERFHFENFTVLGMLVCTRVSWSISSMTVNASHSRWEWKKSKVVCCCYSKQNAAKGFYFLTISLKLWISSLAHITIQNQRKICFLFSSLQHHATMSVILLCRNRCFPGCPTFLKGTSTRQSGVAKRQSKNMASNSG